MKFIRLDRVGHWRHQDHRSSWGGLWDEFPGLFARGVNCYSLTNTAYSLESIRRYWFHTAMVDTEALSDFQITVFEGEKLDTIGSDLEDLTIPTATLKEIPAKDIMLRIQDLWMDERCVEITESEYFSRLLEIAEKEEII